MIFQGYEKKGYSASESSSGSRSPIALLIYIFSTFPQPPEPFSTTDIAICSAFMILLFAEFSTCLASMTTLIAGAAVFAAAPATFLREYPLLGTSHAVTYRDISEGDHIVKSEKLQI